jgi:hypothetical protein
MAGKKDLVKVHPNERIDLPDFTAVQANCRSETREVLQAMCVTGDYDRGEHTEAQIHTPTYDNTSPSGAEWELAFWHQYAATVTGQPGEENLGLIGVGTYFVDSLTGYDKCIFYSPFRVTGTLQSLTVVAGVGAVGVTDPDPNTVSEFGVVIGLEGDTSITIDTSGLAAGPYGIWVSAVWDDAAPGARVFWNNSTASELSQTVTTRQSASWNVHLKSIDLTSMDPQNANPAVAEDGWAMVGFAVWDGADWATSTISELTNSLFEGVLHNIKLAGQPLRPTNWASINWTPSPTEPEFVAKSRTWGDAGRLGVQGMAEPARSDRLIPLSDRSPDRLTWGVQSTAEFYGAIRRQLSDLIGGQSVQNGIQGVNNPAPGGDTVSDAVTIEGTIDLVNNFPAITNETLIVTIDAILSWTAQWTANNEADADALLASINAAYRNPADDHGVTATLGPNNGLVLTRTKVYNPAAILNFQMSDCGQLQVAPVAASTINTLLGLDESLREATYTKGWYSPMPTTSGYRDPLNPANIDIDGPIPGGTPVSMLILRDHIDHNYNPHGSTLHQDHFRVFNNTHLSYNEDFGGVPTKVTVGLSYPLSIQPREVNVWGNVMLLTAINTNFPVPQQGASDDRTGELQLGAMRATRHGTSGPNLAGETLDVLFKGGFNIEHDLFFNSPELVEHGGGVQTPGAAQVGPGDLHVRRNANIGWDSVVLSSGVPSPGSAAVDGVYIGRQQGVQVGAEPLVRLFGNVEIDSIPGGSPANLTAVGTGDNQSIIFNGALGRNMLANLSLTGNFNFLPGFDPHVIMFRSNTTGDPQGHRVRRFVGPAAFQSWNYQLINPSTVITPQLHLTLGYVQPQIVGGSSIPPFLLLHLNEYAGNAASGGGLFTQMPRVLLKAIRVYMGVGTALAPADLLPSLTLVSYQDVIVGENYPHATTTPTAFHGTGFVTIAQLTAGNSFDGLSGRVQNLNHVTTGLTMDNGFYNWDFDSGANPIPEDDQRAHEYGKLMLIVAAPAAQGGGGSNLAPFAGIELDFEVFAHHP